MKITLRVILLLIITGFITSCGGKTTEEDIQIAMTYVAETQVIQSPTPAPTLTSPPQPSATPIPTASPEPVPDTTSSDPEISWKDANLYFGESVTVCGPVVGTHFASDSNGQPTFLNVGEDYPSQDRLVVVIWGENLAQFPDNPENYYYGETICVTGEIEEYQGVYQVEAERESDIEIE